MRLAFITALVTELGSSAANMLDMGEFSEDSRISMDVDVVHSLHHRLVHIDLCHKSQANEPTARMRIGCQFRLQPRTCAV